MARSIQVRRWDFNNELDVLALRLDRYDGSGNRLDPVAVELPGYRSGQVSEGEEIEVTGRWSNGTLRADKIVNLSTNAELRGFPKGVQILQVIIFIFICVFILAIWGFLLFGLLSELLRHFRFR